jgi:uncharacterized protein (DUF1330 family)
MAKGYWIGRVHVHNEEGYKAYAAANPAIFRKYGGRFVVRGGKFECPEGESRSRNVVIEFDNYDAAVACYRSPEYQANIKVRQPHAIADLIIVEGYNGPQPSFLFSALRREGRALRLRNDAGAREGPPPAPLRRIPLSGGGIGPRRLLPYTAAAISRAHGVKAHGW